MSVLTLTEADVHDLLTLDMALEAVEDVLRRHALDEAPNNPRSRCQTDHVMLHVMSGAAKGLGVLGYKAYATSRQGASFHVGLFDGASGELLALMQADYLGQVRTGAASGVATTHLARPDAQKVGILGSGKQARTQLLAVCKVRPITRIHVFSPNEERRRHFAAEMSKECGCDVIPAASAEHAVRDQDIVITATTSRTPVLLGEWLAPGTHLNVIGSNFLGKAEVDVAAVRRSALIVVDNKDQAKLEAGDLKQAVDAGAIHWSDVRELGAVIVGRQKGREHPDDVTLFKSVGIALEDVAVAAQIYVKAKQAGAGKTLEW